jgi:hypothetical protein
LKVGALGNEETELAQPFSNLPVFSALSVFEKLAGKSVSRNSKHLLIASFNTLESALGKKIARS